MAFKLWAGRGKEEQWASGGRRQRKRKAGEDARKISELDSMRSRCAAVSCKLRVERRHLPEPDQATRAHHCREGLSGKVSSKTAQNHSISRFGFGKLRRVMTGLRKLVSISEIYLEM